MTHASGLSYRSDVDGLRAVAVLAVLIYHSGLGLPGGYVGVDVFFVISGYLITRIIDRDVQAGRFSYWEFWTRRARRLIPAMAVLVLLVAAAGWFLLLPHDYRELGQATVAQSVGLANFYFWREAGYFAGPSEIKPLLHMWSLAVEEQFYLVMPVLMMLLYRLAGARYLTILSMLAAVSFGWCVYQTSVSPDSAFYLLPARAWELLLGGMVAAVAERRVPGRMPAEIISGLGLAAILASVLLFDRSTVFPGAAAAVPCLGTAAVIYGNSGERTRVGALLSLRPVVFIGLISYSLYLFHWPIFAYAAYMRPGEPTVAGNLLLMACSLVLGALSWRFVEQPFRTGDFWRSKSRVLPASAVALSGLLGLGLLLHQAGGLRSRFTSEVLQFADARSDRNPRRRDHHDLSTAALRAGLPRLGCNQSDDPLLAVIGDSHGDAMMPLLHDLACEFNVPAVCVTGSATLPLVFQPQDSPPDHSGFYHAVRDQLTQLTSLSDVVLIGRWTGYDDDEMTMDAWQETVRGLQQLDVRLWVVRQVPEPTADVPRSLALGAHWSRSAAYAAGTSEDYQRSRTAADRIFSADSPEFVRFIEPAPFFFSESETALIQFDQRPLYFDDNHLSAFGALQLKRFLVPVFEQIAEQRSEAASGAAEGPRVADVRDDPPRRAPEVREDGGDRQ